jgi:hypothetical protein
VYMVMNLWVPSLLYGVLYVWLKAESHDTHTYKRN